VGDAARFSDRDRFAAYNGTAPVEVSSGERKIHRLSLRGNRRLNHAIHMAAVTQIRHAHSEGRAYFKKKIAEGKTRKQTLRALKRASSATPSTCGSRPTLPTGYAGKLTARRAIGERLCLQRGQLTPQAPALRTSHSRTSTQPTAKRPCPPGSPSGTVQELRTERLDNKEVFDLLAEDGSRQWADRRAEGGNLRLD
jgi:Transposase IS116/IS110/IS902 family